MKTIEVETSQNIVIQYELATFMQRTLAYLLDAVIVFILAFLFFVFVGVQMLEVFQFGGAVTFTFFSIVIGYFFLFETFVYGQTIGKMALGIKVISTEGIKPKYGDILIRSIFMMLDVFFSIGTLGFLLISATEKSQRMGDLIAQTLVVKTNPDNSYSLREVLKISKGKDFEPTYPEVISLTDDDILFIKNVISRYRKNSHDVNKNIVIDLVKKIDEKLSIQKGEKESHISFLNKIITDYVHLTR